ncbi:MAG: FAD-binding oxidoreductase [Pseudomonadales bacterium]|jgi:FAD/FMN-containing dehydrogenase|nr:FAD-binding oxidoreductase [Pseudomonadales bacterium]
MNTMNQNLNALLDRLAQVLSSPILTHGDIGARYHSDWSVETPCAPLALLRPGTTQEVVAVLRLCHEAGQAVVVQGGLSGLCGGATPRAGELALSLERLSGIEEIDSAAMTMTVQAGTPLEVVQEAAARAGFVFPLDLGARGTCSIGGNISTNAGGNQVLRFGMMRNLVLGLEAVLPDGSVISAMNKMLKNNAAYDLKHLFIGSEGTLGVVTRAVLRLFPRAASRVSALLALEDFPAVIAVLQRLSRGVGGGLCAFEVMWNDYYRYITATIGKARSPFQQHYPLYLLAELEGADAARDRAAYEAVLEELLDAGLLRDAVLASSERERAEFWQIRDGVAELGNYLKGAANFDVSVPISAMAAFLDDVERGIKNVFPGATFLAFGHVADSNLHFICATGQREDVKTLYDIVYAAVGRFAGSVSAEHGIGVQKVPYLHHSRSPEELALMRTLKTALDPKGILNPGRVLP